FSELSGLGKGPNYDVQNGPFAPVCDIQNLGKNICLKSKNDSINFIPQPCKLPKLPLFKDCD
ncbi:hypothetical protein HK099_001355, partial [Clydaea vesicula]